MIDRERPTYPKNRERFFAQRCMRAFFRVCGMQELGIDAFALLSIIVTTEDAAHYRRPVFYFNPTLQQLLGFPKWDRLDAARKRLVQAGWLHYEPPPCGSRGRAGKYWATIPEYAAGLKDAPLDATDHPPERDTVATSPSPGTGYGQAGPYPETVYAQGDGQGDAQGEHSYPVPVPVPSSCPGRSAPDQQAARKPKARKSQFGADDMATAKWMFQEVRKLQPDRREPNFDRWADCIRLMVQADRRTYPEIRDLFERVMADPFWCKNVLCPEKLREKWDDLQLRLARSQPKASAPTKTSLYIPRPRKAGATL